MSLALVAHLAEHALEELIAAASHEVVAKCGDLTKNEKTALVTATVMKSFHSIRPLWDTVHTEKTRGNAVFSIGPRGARHEAPSSIQEFSRWFANEFMNGHRFAVERDGELVELPHVKPEQVSLRRARDEALSLS